MTHGNVKLCDECMAELLMWLDRKTENCSEKPNNCEPQMDCVKCKSFQYNGWYCTAKTNGYPCKFEPKDEPQTTSTPYKVDTSSICKIEPQTERSK